MDSDDISMPERFEKAACVPARASRERAVGTRVVLIDPYGLARREADAQTTHEEIEAELLAGIGWALVHPSVMMRREPLIAVGGYREDLMVSEDLDLFLRLAKSEAREPAGRAAAVPTAPGSVNYTKYEQQKA
jgi:hypothetical protein